MTSETASADALDSPYAWRRLAVSLLISTVGGVGLWSVVVVLPAIEVEFGVDRGGASLPYTATMFGFAAGSVLMGRLTDRFGITVPVMLGGIMLGVGYMLAAQASELWHFIAVQALLVGMLGGSVTFGPIVADVSLWFARRRGVAIAIAACGNYLSGTIWPPILQYGIDTVGWRETHMWVGVVCIAVMIPLALLLRRRPSTDDTAAEAAGGNVNRAASRYSPKTIQVLLIMAGIACCVAMSMPQVHIVAYCGDLGYGPAVGAEMLSLMLGLGVVSRIGMGVIADRIGGLGTLILGSVLQGIALVFYLPFDGLASLYVVSAIFGLAQGGIVPSYAVIVREYFPAREAATRVSFIFMISVLGMALGGWLSGEIYDLTGSYQMAFLNGIGWNLLNLGIALWLLMGRRPLRPAMAS